MDLEGSLPDAQVIPRSHDRNGFRMGPSVILRTAEQAKLAHGHRKVGFFGEAFEDAVQYGAADVGIDLHPSGRSKYPLHGRFRAENQEIDHVARVTILVTNPAGNFG